MATPSDRWTLNRSALASLIDRLGAGDPLEYEVIRRRLVAFMSWRGAAQPEAAADETLDRVARKLESGVEVASIRGYLFGVARRVLLESERRERRDRVVQEAWVLLHRRPDAGEERERRIACLGRCLAGLSPENRALIQAYHGSGPGDARAALARRYGLSDGALRIRAHRIRNDLGACLGRCLAGGDRDE
jgi:DNA-directed RNA polymerase specialized sigma24 family protein